MVINPKKPVAFLLILFLSGFAVFITGYLIPVKGRRYGSCQEKIPVRVQTNGFHTAFVLPAVTEYIDWTEFLPHKETYRYVEFGWGDKGYYMSEKDFPILEAISAIAWPTRSVMHVVYYSEDPVMPFKDTQVENFLLCREAYINLVAFIKKSFENKPGIRKLGQGLYGISAFYPARKKYHLFYTCNTWIAEGLCIAGRETALLPITAGSVIYHLKTERSED